MKKILLSCAVVMLLLSACTDNKEESKAVVPKSTIKIEQSTKSNVEIIKEKSHEIANSSKELVKAIGNETKDIVSNSSEITKDVVQKATSVTKDVVAKAQDITKDISEKIDNVIQTKEEPKINIDSLYVKCAGCHGKNGEKRALGKSQIIKGWDKDKIEESLLGYKDGTYGGNMKGLMIGQVMNLSNEDIEALAEHISKF